MMTIYQQELIDHYRNPRNKGALPSPALVGALQNHSCGDAVTIYVQLAQDRVMAVAFEGQGCVISQAAASLLTEHCRNKTLAYIRTLEVHFMQQLIGVSLGPVRLKCAALALDALHQACGFV